MLFVVRPPMLFGNDAIADEQEEGVDANAFHVQRLTGSIFGVLSAFLAAGAYLSIRLIGKKESSLTIAVWFHSTAFIHSVVLLLLGWPQQPVWPSTRDCACFVGIAVSSFIANILLSRGFQLENAALASAVNYLQVICSHILGIAVFHEKLEPISLAGAGLILFGVVTVAVDSKKHEQHHGGLVLSSDSDARDGVELTMTAQKPPTDQEQDEEDAPLLQPRR
jgi:drug/metabolite transporter (DMT)-like permease